MMKHLLLILGILVMSVVGTVSTVSAQIFTKTVSVQSGVQNAISAPAISGSIVSYTLTFINTGSTLLNIVATDYFPFSGVQFIAGTRAIVDAGGTTLSSISVSPTDPSTSGLFIPGQGLPVFFSLGSGDRVVITLTGRVTTNTFPVAGWVNTGQVDSIVPLLQFVSSATLTAIPELTITKIFTGTQPQLSGDTVRWDINVCNIGSAPANAISVGDTVSSQLNTIPTINIPVLAIDSCTLLNLSTTLNNNYYSGTQFSNTGSVSIVSEFFTGNNSVFATGLVAPIADLWIAKVFTGTSPRMSGDLVTFSISFGNSGSLNLTSGFTIVDTLDSRINFVSQSSNYAGLTFAVVGNQIIFTGNAGLTANSTFTGQIILTGVLNANFTGVFTNTGTITTVQREFTTGNNQTFTTGFSVGMPDLMISKIRTGAAAFNGLTGGAIVTYEITVTNTGTTGSSIATVTDIFSNLTGVSANIPFVAVSATGISWTVPALPVGGTQVVVVTGSVLSTLITGDIFSNSASVALNGFVVVNSPELTTGNNTTLSVIDVAGGSADLSVTKNFTGRIPQLSGDSVQYIITFANNGDAFASGVTVIDILSGELAYISDVRSSNISAPVVTVGGGNSTLLGFSIPTGLFPGQTGQIIVNAVLRTGFQFPGTFTNAVLITGANLQFEAVTGDNQTGVTLVLAGTPDMSGSKVLPSGTHQQSGDLVQYLISYENIGTTSVSGFTITDILPSQLVFSGQSSSLGFVRVGNTLTWTGGALGTGQTGQILIQAVLANNFAQPTFFINTGSIVSTGTFVETNLANNTFGPVTGITLGLPDLSVQKALTSLLPTRNGSGISFQLTVTNVGSGPASNVVITDTFPSQLDYISSNTTSTMSAFGTSAVVSGTDLTWTLSGVLQSGQSVIINVTGVMNSGYIGGTQFTNFLTVTGSVFEFITGNNQTGLTLTVPVLTGASFVKSIQTPNPLRTGIINGRASGDAITFVIDYVNTGNVPLNNVTITDTLSSVLSGANVLLTGITLAPGQTGQIFVPVVIRQQNFVSTLNTATFAGPLNIVSTVVINESLMCGNGALEQTEDCEFNAGVPFAASGVLLSGQQCNINICRVQTTGLTNTVTMNYQTPDGAVVGFVTTGVDVQISGTLAGPYLTKSVTLNTTGSATSGTVVSYTIQYGNIGTGQVFGVRVFDLWPSEITFVSSSLPFNGTLTGGWSFGTLSGTTGGQIVLTGIVNTNIVTTIFNTGVMQYVDANGTGQLTAVASFSATGIVPPAGPACTITPNPSSFTQGASTTLTLGTTGTISSSTVTLFSTTGSVLQTGSTGFVTPVLNTVGNYTAQCVVVGPTGIATGVAGFTVNAPGGGGGGNVTPPSGGGGGGSRPLYPDDCSNDGIRFDSVGNPLGDPKDLSPSYYDGLCYGGGNFTPTTRVGPQCMFADTTNFSIQAGEDLPFWFGVENFNSNNVASSCVGAPAGTIDASSVRCDFKVYNGKNLESSTNGFDILNTPCGQDTVTGVPLFRSITNGSDTYNIKAGARFIRLDPRRLGDALGEYKLSLEQVQYNTCDGNGASVSQQSLARVCQVNFAVTRPYLMQRGVSSNTTNDDLSDFYLINGQRSFSASVLDGIKTVDANSYDGGSTVKNLLSSFVSKYQKLAIQVPAGVIKDRNQGRDSLAKVPGKNMYVFDANKGIVTLKQQAFMDSPFTVIVKNGDLVIRGNIKGNGLFIVPDGDVYIGKDLDDKSNACDAPQVIEGIFVTNGSFRSGIGDNLNTINANNPTQWCKYGNLHVKGLMIGKNLEDLVSSRRSSLNDWFNIPAVNTTESQRNVVRRQKIFEGAAVLIDTNTRLWLNLPPGADELQNTFNIYKK